MDSTKGFVGLATALAFLGLAGGLPTGNALAVERAQPAMMDEMKMKSDPLSNTNNMGSMGQPGNQSQSSGGGRADDRMKMQMPGQMQDCQGAGCQPRDTNMMQMMHRMNQQMNAPSGTRMEVGSDATASGPADVTERLEGRIAFLKAAFQITDEQMADWNRLGRRAALQPSAPARSTQATCDGRQSDWPRASRSL